VLGLTIQGLLLLEQVQHVHLQGLAQLLRLDDVYPPDKGLDFADDGLIETLAEPVGDLGLGKPQLLPPLDQALDDGPVLRLVDALHVLRIDPLAEYAKFAYYSAGGDLVDGRAYPFSHEEIDEEPVFRLLVSYFSGDRARAVAEVAPLLKEGRTLKDACEVVIASGGFEISFY